MSGFGRILTRILVSETGPGINWRLRAVVVRDSENPEDLIKRASLLRNDSVHGTFPGTIRVNRKNNSLIVNGNEIVFIYASDPRKVDYKKKKDNGLWSQGISC